MQSIQTLTKESILLLQSLICIPSFSKEEDKTALEISRFLRESQIAYQRKGNNIWCHNRFFDPDKPTILLNSHHDTVKPNSGYTRDPFLSTIEEDKLYGLGSNDAGGSLVSLLAAFRYFNDKKDLKYNLCYAATAEEEISGRNGIESIFDDLGELDFAIVGEPTLMQLAIAERGLMVIDCEATGKAGHAARNEGENAIYKAIEDINWFRTFRFPKESTVFGPISMNVTIIEAGSQHNVIPASCKFTVDIRVTDAYSNEEVLEIIQRHIKSQAIARSTRLKPSSISLSHPIVKAGIALGHETYGSPTTSDQALLNIPSLKLGPGDSARSHMADEYIYIHEIEEGIKFYIQILDSILH
ncbi:M20 family metallo-hydrolase [Albibacterium bauzanense]|uniref:Acetylornithine deacetylase n=1 Tax=Albibacterium bauzanense TaxID=653929 RepID=A0A4R1LV32_9SPHI|nr:M20 family metallo-hydrolase [Albibacterium bauzanense]TCK82945.1 acetylornithine deacetylase [Albibacterium bauzanense]